MTAPSSVGTYYAALFPNNGTTPSVVAQFAVSSGGGGGSTPSISLNSTTPSPGSSVTATLSGAPASGQDSGSWVGICNSGATSSGNCDGAGYDWDYLGNPCSKSRPSAIVTSPAPCTINVPSSSTAGTYNYQVAWFPTNTNYTALATVSFSVTVSGGGGGGGGTGCQDADMASTYIPSQIAAGWHCDSTMSDDFDRDGGVLNTSKWDWGASRAGLITPTTCSGSLTWGPPVLDGSGLHMITTPGPNATEQGVQMLSNWTSPPGPYYVEYKRKGDGTQLGWINADFFTESGSPPALTFNGTTYNTVSTEWDFQENGQLSWFIWGNYWGGPLLVGTTGLGSFGVAYSGSANFYNYAMLRNGANSTFFQNDGNPSPITFANPIPAGQTSPAGVSVFNTTQEYIVWQSWAMAGAPYDNGQCPPANSNITYQYIHTYHP